MSTAKGLAVGYLHLRPSTNTICSLGLHHGVKYWKDVKTGCSIHIVAKPLGIVKPMNAKNQPIISICVFPFPQKWLNLKVAKPR